MMLPLQRCHYGPNHALCGVFDLITLRPYALIKYWQVCPCLRKKPSRLGYAEFEVWLSQTLAK